MEVHMIVDQAFGLMMFFWASTKITFTPIKIKQKKYLGVLDPHYEIDKGNRVNSDQTTAN